MSAVRDFPGGAFLVVAACLWQPIVEAYRGDLEAHDAPQPHAFNVNIQRPLESFDIPGPDAFYRHVYLPNPHIFVSIEGDFQLCAPHALARVAHHTAHGLGSIALAHKPQVFNLKSGSSSLRLRTADEQA